MRGRKCTLTIISKDVMLLLQPWDFSGSLYSKASLHDPKMVIVLSFLCWCQRQGQQQPQSAFQRLAQCLLIQRCLWMREMSCPLPLHGAYITERRGRAPGRNQQKESHYLDDRASLIWSCGWASYRDSGQEQMEGMRQVEHRGRPAVRRGESTLFNAMINSRGGTFSICQKISIFSIIQRVWEWTSADLEVDFKSHTATSI